LRVGGFEVDGDDVAFARGFDVELFLQQRGEPDVDAALAFGGFLPVLLHLGVLVELEQAHDALGDALAVDDVDLRGHVAGHGERGQHHAGDRVGRLDVDDDVGAGAVLLRQQQADDDGGDDGGEQREQRDLLAREQDEQELLEGHGGG